MNGYSPQPPPRNSYSNLSLYPTDSLVRPKPQLSPLTKQVNQLSYEIPKNKYAHNPWNYAPEFLKVFCDIRTHVGGKAVFDCVLLGSPRPKVCWLFNDDTMHFNDVVVDDTADICRLTIPYVMPHHYGKNVYSVVRKRSWTSRCIS
ncbi:hypothetical protein DICVIV_07224 [Dictyocaulus viviparus]|uniref:Immunoglobulin I-set domain-containing protein n=1 Tax=Dictyocaulus viviparus TaxID=29172 RepID=A0A0D8XQA9_DICVI|nr:hypothetical protein DICVIV_07224 [Dictyocaulus viviparus]